MAPVKEAAGPRRRQTFLARRKKQGEKRKMKEEYLRKSDPDILRPGSRLPAEGSVRRPRASAIKLYEIRVYKVNVFSKVSENVE